MRMAYIIICQLVELNLMKQWKKLYVEKQKEEASIDVEVGELAFAYEYATTDECI